MTNKSCHCFIKHPTSDAERKAITECLESARRMGNIQVVMLSLAQLTGKCPAREKD